ncbi:hypothetical protein [Bacillus changyiensis]|uniref:hypothetical protein n=1 Tax=Bacillus changyiensis TaxID=3004103 RepID=UPI0022E15D8A|nr:hypothetical protein [Bacillus changyiensis]MDA1475863.1 hypothetical protein [Bacillus changyiensis]
MSSQTDIQKQFYRVYKGHISIAEFEKWVYKTQDIEKIYGNDFYFNLLDLDYTNKYIKNDLEKLILAIIPFGKFEQIRITSLLDHLIFDNHDIVEILEQLYQD